MKPKPLFELNHFTMPTCMGCPFQEQLRAGSIAVAKSMFWRGSHKPTRQWRESE